MCRRKRPWGIALSALGLGLILGQWFSSMLLCTLAGLVLVAVGLSMIGKT